MTRKQAQEIYREIRAKIPGRTLTTPAGVSFEATGWRREKAGKRWARYQGEWRMRVDEAGIVIENVNSGKIFAIYPA